MLVKFTPKPRTFTIGERVVIVCAGNGTLSGEHLVSRITSQTIWIKITHYVKPSPFEHDGTSRRGHFSSLGIIKVAEAEEQAAAYRAGHREQVCPDFQLYFGEGEI